MGKDRDERLDFAEEFKKRAAYENKKGADLYRRDEFGHKQDRCGQDIPRWYWKISEKPRE